MNEATLGLRELARYYAGEAARWREWLGEQDPSWLALPVGEAQIATVGTLLAHVASVELIYADTLVGTPRPTYEWPPVDALDAICAMHDEAFGKLLAFVEEADADALGRELTLRVRGYRLTAPAGKMVLHLLVHGIRHYAQLATALRAQGHPQPWSHDPITGEGFGPPAEFTRETTVPATDPSA